MNIDLLLHLYQFNANYSKMLLKDIPAEAVCSQPHGLRNHVIWQIGHLARTSDFLGTLYGQPSTLPSGWDELFRRGSVPLEDVSKYPSLDELVGEYDRQHEKISTLIPEIGLEKFAEPIEEEFRRKLFPTLGDFTGFVMVGHEGLHLGQLSGWRKALGLGGVWQDPK